jgi:hypothetical protein
MSRSCGHPLTLGLVLSFCLPSLAESPTNNESAADLRVTVRVYNFAQISPKVLVEAEREATRIFRKVGVETLWLDCPLTLADCQTYPACQQASGLKDFVLRILPKAMAERLSFRGTTFGFALPCPPDESGCIANLFYHCVEQLTQVGNTPRELTLGHAAAHELGHLLLGTNSHSSTGLMKAHWSRRDLRSASFGHLLFTSEQAEVIRPEVLRRIKQQEALQACGGAPAIGYAPNQSCRPSVAFQRR